MYFRQLPVRFYWVRDGKVLATIINQEKNEPYFQVPIKYAIYLPDYYNINVLKQELGTAKTYEHYLLDERSIVDRHQCHMAAKFGVFLMKIIASFLHYTCYLNFIKAPISNVLLLILVHVVLAHLTEPLAHGELCDQWM